MSNNLRFLSGTSITTTDSLIASNQLSTDLLMISHPYIGQGEFAKYESNAITYATLSSQMFADLSDKLEFGTMAFADSGDYALSDHHHSCYNKVDIASYIKDPSEYDLSEYDSVSSNIIISAATFKIDGKSTVVRAVLPNYKPIPVYTPIGTITFVGWPKEYILRHTIDVNSPDFDGWVYCDGREIVVDQTEFLLAQHYFNAVNKDGGKKQFSIPLLTSFVYLKGSAQCLAHDDNQSVPTLKHTHNAKFKYNAQVQAGIRFKVSEKGYSDDDTKLRTFRISSDYVMTNENGKTKKHYCVDDTLAKEIYGEEGNRTMHAYYSKTAHPNMALAGTIAFNNPKITTTVYVSKAMDQFGKYFVPSDTDRYWPNYQYVIPLIYIGRKDGEEFEEG